MDPLVLGLAAFSAACFLAFLPVSFRAERVCGGATGGGRDTGRELSWRGEAKPLGTMRKLASGVIFEGLRTFAPGRDCHSRGLGNWQC